MNDQTRKEIARLAHSLQNTITNKLSEVKDQYQIQGMIQSIENILNDTTNDYIGELQIGFPISQVRNQHVNTLLGKLNDFQNQNDAIAAVVRNSIKQAVERAYYNFRNNQNNNNNNNNGNTYWSTVVGTAIVALSATLLWFRKRRR